MFRFSELGLAVLDIPGIELWIPMATVGVLITLFILILLLLLLFRFAVPPEGAVAFRILLVLLEMGCMVLDAEELRDKVLFEAGLFAIAFARGLGPSAFRKIPFPLTLGFVLPWFMVFVLFAPNPPFRSPVPKNVLDGGVSDSTNLEFPFMFGFVFIVVCCWSEYVYM